MLLLGFSIGCEHYAIDASRIVEIVPRVRLRRIPLTQHYVAGVLDFRGAPLPVIDLCQLMEERDCCARMSTRIIITRLETPNGQERLLGLIAEQVTETFTQDPAQFQDPGIKVDAAGFLGGVARRARGAVQYVDAEQLLPEMLLHQLFAHTDEEQAAQAPGA